MPKKHTIWMTKPKVMVNKDFRKFLNFRVRTSSLAKTCNGSIEDSLQNLGSITQLLPLAQNPGNFVLVKVRSINATSSGNIEFALKCMGNLWETIWILCEGQGLSNRAQILQGAFYRAITRFCQTRSLNSKIYNFRKSLLCIDEEQQQLQYFTKNQNLSNEI